MSLITNSDVKEYSQITFEDLNLATLDFDSLVDLLIETWQGSMESYCDRNWNHYSDVTKEYSVGYKDQVMIMIDGPVISITSVSTRGTKGGSFSVFDSDLYTAVKFNDYANMTKLRRIGQTNMAPRKRTNKWRGGWENIEVIGSWGYATVPDAIKNILLRMVDLSLRGLKKNRREKVRNRTVKKDDVTPMIILPKDIKEELRPWKSIKNFAGVL